MERIALSRSDLRSRTAIALGNLPGILLTGLLIMWALEGFARICISTASGNWNQASTWTCGSVPTGGDTVIVMAGHTVQVTNNYSYTGAPLQIQVYGVLQFNGGGSKLSLPCGSHVEIMDGGSLLPDPNYNGFSETVRICNVTYWNTTMGPQYGYIIWPPPNPLPVELVHLSAASDGELVEVRWTTASERDSRHFEVMRSRELTDRVVVGLVPAAGNSSNLQQYSHQDAPAEGGLFYYHLREIPMDGHAVELGSVAIDHLKRGTRILCSPNPLARDQWMNIRIPPVTKGIDLHLIGPGGHWMRPSFVEAEEHLAVVFDGLDVVPGIYTMQVIEGDQVLGTCRFRLD